MIDEKKTSGNYWFFAGGVTVTVCRSCSISRRRNVPGTLNILSINRWQSVTASSRTMRRNKLANAEISSHANISVLWLMNSVRQTRNNIWKSKEINFGQTNNGNDCLGLKFQYLWMCVWVGYTLLPSWNKQSHIRSTVSMGSTSANIQMKYLVVITAHGKPHRSKCSHTSGARSISNSRSTAMSVISPVIVFVWYDDIIFSTSTFSSQKVHSSFFVTNKMRPAI